MTLHLHTKSQVEAIKNCNRIHVVGDAEWALFDQMFANAKPGQRGVLTEIKIATLVTNMLKKILFILNLVSKNFYTFRDICF